MRHKFVPLWIIGFFFVLCHDAIAIYYNLSDEQVEQAIEYGEKNNDLDYMTFLSEWVVISQEGYEWAALNTKFNLLAYEAKQASLSARKLTEAQIYHSFLKTEDILSFHVVLYGNSPDFSKDYHAVLLYKNKPIQPVTEQNDTHARLANFGIRLAAGYRATCRYDFPDYYVEPDEEVTLIILSPLNKERRFVFHLKEMR
ncbi:MAG: hypothetical protein HRU72_03090 [Planctomycetia bacterium]|jgi:hypothetical protein|nr:hypothetical protein [Candidatus Brocadia sapporoensis]MCC7238963.1 hypothetical protein [Candidatus Brocadia sp.]OQZ02412.1 MAG: hypothetical protein B6D34_11070 [Candidatus Brocadia sp. UTAMX1]QOJ05601.1 MAG: hypothetical protein HRU72_03090 [Planctomycetia bacterium]RZV59743.1 MAG: hypothetical protein EX330_00775 [Candidatus Brocadia sp. BROELEC01]TVL97313.1 MAG: hypothetical protein CV082_04425 [Candidatus Brocadia sp. BL1]TWU50080.1 hypothetical protein B188_25090 [Candidatus Brocadi